MPETMEYRLLLAADIVPDFENQIERMLKIIYFVLTYSKVIQQFKFFVSLQTYSFDFLGPLSMCRLCENLLTYFVTCMMLDVSEQQHNVVEGHQLM